MPNRSRITKPTLKSSRTRKSKPAPDENQLAYKLVEHTEVMGADIVATEAKNPAAVALGRLGGLKGGKARAAKLSKTQRRDSARKAAQARWKR